MGESSLFYSADFLKLEARVWRRVCPAAQNPNCVPLLDISCCTTGDPCCGGSLHRKKGTASMQAELE